MNYNLTSQHLAELRKIADNANYIVILKRNEVLALLDAADERDRLAAAFERLIEQGKR